MEKELEVDNRFSTLIESKERIGNALIELLGLKVKSNGRVDTSGGDKTPLGLALTVERILEETL